MALRSDPQPRSVVLPGDCKHAAVRTGRHCQHPPGMADQRTHRRPLITSYKRTVPSSSNASAICAAAVASSASEKTRSLCVTAAAVPGALRAGVASALVIVAGIGLLIVGGFELSPGQDGPWRPALVHEPPESCRGTVCAAGGHGVDVGEEPAGEHG